jgi:hypothetical protein
MTERFASFERDDLPGDCQNRRHLTGGFQGALIVTSEKLRFDPGQKLRGSKTSRWARRRMVVLRHRHESIPVHVEPELEQRAVFVYLESSRRGCGGYTAKNGVLFYKAGESTKLTRIPLHAIYAAHRPDSSVDPAFFR